MELLWTSVDHPATEDCIVELKDGMMEVDSIIAGKKDGKMYRLKYHAQLTHDWLFNLASIEFRFADSTQEFRVSKSGNGGCILNDQPAPEFNGCDYIDIALTPFTNSLPINHLELKVGESREISVIYFDLFENVLKPVHQCYERRSQDEYLYQNIPNDFEALIKVDGQGYVTDYPGLFKRTYEEEEP